MVNLTPEARENFICCVVMLFATLVFVSLRFYLRVSLRQQPFLSDWLCLLSFFTLVTSAALIFNHIFKVSKYGAFEYPTTLGGQGQPDSYETQMFMKMIYTCELLFVGAISLAKLSICALYWTLFSIKVVYKRLIIVATIASVAWWIIFTFLVIFQCTPVDAWWLKSGSPEYCIATPRLLLGLELTNLFVDIFIMSIPVFAIRSLQLTTHKKWSVAGLFLLGTAVCACSIIRLAAIWRPEHWMKFYDGSKITLFSTMQVGMAIVCSCLPTLGPLFWSNRSSGNGRKPVAVHQQHGASDHQLWGEDSNENGRLWGNVDGDQSIGSTHSLHPLPRTKINR